MSLTNIVLSSALSGIVGFVLVVPAIAEEWRERRHKHNLPVLVDVKPNWWPGLTHRELFFVGLFVHIILCMLFGLVYAVFVEQDWLFITRSSYSLLSLVIYAVCVWLVTCVVFFPLIGFGFFGRKEEGHVWAEILATYLILGLALWLLARWFQPAYFVI